MRTVLLPGGETVAALGLGTWRMGESSRKRRAEVAAVREAIQLGYRLFDTAEMYGEGGAEAMLGEALHGAIAAGEVKREELFVVSKVYPHNASRRGTIAACERSLARLRLDTVDLYLLHWRGAHPLVETVDAFQILKQQGRIRHFGVSNFDVDDMRELWAVPGGDACAANQVWYSASQRGVEFRLSPWLREHGVALMAYSPIDQAALARHAALGDSRASARCQRRVGRPRVGAAPGGARDPEGSAKRTPAGKPRRRGARARRGCAAGDRRRLSAAAPCDGARHQLNAPAALSHAAARN